VSARERLAFVSPLPPVRSGIADYARDLLPHIGRDFDVDLFVDDRHSLVRQATYAQMPVHPAAELRKRYAGFRHVVYQLGNNLHHRFVLELARDLPGTIVLHDLVLHHLFEEIAGVEDEWQRYGEALRESYGEPGAAVLRWKRWRFASERENFALPLFEPLAARSRAVLVHSDAAAAEVRRRLPQAAVARIPMGMPPQAPLDRDSARRRLAVPHSRVVIGAFGFITPIKRLDVLAAALRRLWPELPDLQLVLIGETSPGVHLEAIFTAEERSSARVVHRGYVSADEYRDWMAATDVAVNLRYPSAGETSASLLRLLADGKCTVVSAYRQFLEIPSPAVVRIPLGAEEESELARELSSLARDPTRRMRIGEAARGYASTEHSMEAAARGFAQALRRFERDPSSGADWPRPLAPCHSTSRSAAVRGRVVATDPVALRVRPGATAVVALRVTNDGGSRWISTGEPSGGHVGVGAEVSSPDGRRIGSIAPVTLPRDLEPGEGATLRLAVEAPRDPGAYSVVPKIVHFGRRSSFVAGPPIALVVTADAA